ncbi:ABC transporter permease [Mesorhizobium sp. BR1-1-16]|uniref:ABC transporter permease n=1 Tax=Mesorhizobium sp. BR1-1-16 TaxID=2876653 RepID=UPI001CCD39F0|nr:ABC transporter permease [Mesorhizobium sp. BR1-1-16]MBZ9939277.1 ABC transporter permease [Mesorhizobium sp. BR1-1-16]
MSTPIPIVADTVDRGTGIASPRRQLLRRMLRSRSLVIGGSIVLFVVLVALLAPIIAPFDPDHIGTGRRLAVPGGKFLLGTDEFGRDILSRVIFGARYTLYIGLVAVGIGLVFGVAIGAAAAYAGGWFGGLLMRVMDLLYTFPDVLIALGLVAFLGPNLTNAMIAVGLSAIPYYARVTYAVVLSERQKPYVDAAQVVGASHIRVVVRHLMPNVLPPMIVVASLGFSAAVLSAAALSFLGLGAQPPMPEWGLMLSTGRNYITRAPWLVVGPGVAIFVTVMAFNLFGDGVRDLLDPRQRQRTL